MYELLRGKGWKEKTLYAFTGLDGNKPEGGLVFDKAGNLYGTTEIGGRYDMGTIFKLAPASGGKWRETVLHSFNGRRDGAAPLSSLILDKAGNLYGATSYGGGGSGCGGHGCGVVFKLTPGSGGHWNETVLHRFYGGRDGSVPNVDKLVFDASGNLYGVTIAGGQGTCNNGAGCGVVFEITP